MVSKMRDLTFQPLLLRYKFTQRLDLTMRSLNVFELLFKMNLLGFHTLDRRVDLRKLARQLVTFGAFPLKLLQACKRGSMAFGIFSYCGDFRCRLARSVQLNISLREYKLCPGRLAAKLFKIGERRRHLCF